MSDQVEGDETPDGQKWKVEAQKFQQEMFLRLGDREWDVWNKSDKDILCRKISYGLDFQPERNSETVELIADTILKYAESGNEIHFACIFIFGERKSEWFCDPVFKVKGKQDQALFIDSGCHVYENWQNYLNFNHLPKCSYCYPCDGLYQANQEKKVLVGFGTSPACVPQIKISNNYASILKLMHSLWTDAPIQAHGCGLTSVGTNVSEVVPTDVSEASVDHLNVRKNFLMVVQNLMYENITLAAAAGEVATVEERIAYEVVTFNSRNLSLTLNGLKTLTDIFVLIDKKNKNTLTKDDVLLFESSVLFFSNNLLNANMAKEIIEDTQKNVLNQHCRDLTPSEIGELFKLIKFCKGKNQLQRNTYNIKAINRIPDKRTFYESLVTIKGDLEDHQVGFSSEGPGVININNELHVAPNKFVEISAIDRQQILDATKTLQATGINDVWRKKIEEILKKNRLVMQYQRDEKIKKVKQAFNTENLDTIKIDGKKFFQNMIPCELDRLFTAITGAGKYSSKILEITNKFATMLKCKNLRDYINYVEFVTKYVSKLKEDVISDYNEGLNNAKITRGIDESKFLLEKGIKEKKDVYFCNQVYGKFLTNPEESFRTLEEKYLDVEKNVLPINAKTVPNFACDTSAVYHYYKHSDFNDKSLTEEEYFALASELVNEPLNRLSAQLNQQGDGVIIKFTNPINGAVGIVFEKLIVGKQSLATVFYEKAVLKKSNQELAM